jgi:hypothetical protein
MTVIWLSSIFQLEGQSNAGRLIPLIALYIAGITLLINLIIRFTLVYFKKAGEKLMLTHKYSSLLIAISVLTDIISLILIE